MNQLLLESIRITQRQIPDWHWHKARMQRSLQMLLGTIPDWLGEDFTLTLPKEVDESLHKCRLIYGETITKIEFLPYTPRAIRSLQIVEAPQLKYAYKWENRRAIEALFSQKGKADDILICQNGEIRDTSYCNVLFSDGWRWYTPEQALLPGTQRAKLLEEGLILPRRLSLSDLAHFRKVKLINAMLPFAQAPEISVEAIIR